MFCPINIWLTQKRRGLENSRPGLILVVIYMRMVPTQTGPRIFRLGVTTEVKLDLSEFIVRPPQCHVNA